MFRVVVFFLLAVPATALYSVHFIPGSENNNILGKHGYFVEAPDATHIADIYARLAGAGPILHEDEINLPILDVSSKKLGAKPVLVEVTGGVVSKSFARPVMLSANTHKGPELTDIAEVLKQNAVVVESKKFESLSEAKEWAEGQTKPVVLLHHEQVSAKHATRLLANSSNAYMPLTEEDISSYQIFYWVFFVLLGLLLTGVLSIFSMEVLPDSLLFAKFQSSRTGKTD